MFAHQPVAHLVGATLLVVPLYAVSQTDRWHGGWHDRYPYRSGYDRVPEKHLVEKYDTFAGSDENARSLVKGLRNDKRIELSKGDRSSTFKPPTDQMGYGNVDIALGLAKTSLAQQGIHKPTPEQIKAALNGGTITTKSGEQIALPGVLKLRASGMGWGEIAHTHGFKLGEVMRSHKDNKHADKKHDHRHADRKRDHKNLDWTNHKRQVHWKHDRRHDRADWRHERKAERADWRHGRADWKGDRPDWKHQGRPDFHRARLARPHRPDKFHRPGKVERPHRPERPERHHHRR